MRTSEIVPTGAERLLAPDEVIVSKTDPKGIITYVNSVFTRVSGYPEHELLGRPHSVIRHPDMPRAVFKLLWDTIAAGDEVFAYVLNLARDGAHYWVLAHVTPTFDGRRHIVGYHSNRRAPARAAIDVVQPLYRALYDAERRHPRSSEALAASTALLEDTLRRAGQSYDEFVWSVTPVEVAR